MEHDITLRARQVFSQDRYATALTGIAIDHVGERSATCSLSLGDMHRNAKGAVMGGVLYTLADLAFAVAVHSQDLAATPAGEEPMLSWVSVSATIHYVNATHGDRLKAEARCIKQGRRIALYQTSIYDSEGRLVALVETQGSRVDVAGAADKQNPQS